MTDIDKLVPDPNNVRAHDERSIDIIGESLKAFGVNRPIVADEDGTVLAGNGVLEAAREVGIRKTRVVEVDGDEIVAVQVRHLTDDQKRQYAVADNRAGELSTWDTEKLGEQIKNGLDVTGFWFEGELARLVGDVIESEEEQERHEQATRAWEEKDAQRSAEALIVTCPYCYHEWVPDRSVPVEGEEEQDSDAVQ